MITLYACALLVLVHAVLPGSRLSLLARVRFRHTWLVWAALGAQVLIISVLPDGGRASDAAHLGTYVLAAAFVVLNVRRSGTWMVAAGGGLNLAAIAANGGVMPASADALAASGWEPEPGQFANSDVLVDPRLALLGDVFATPSWLPVESVYSIGDVVVVLGVALFLQLTCRPRARARQPPVEPGALVNRSPFTSAESPTEDGT